MEQQKQVQSKSIFDMVKSAVYPLSYLDTVGDKLKDKTVRCLKDPHTGAEGFIVKDEDGTL